MEQFNFHEACVVIPRKKHFDQKVIELLPRKIRVRRVTVAANEEIMDDEPTQQDDEPSQMNVESSPGPSKISQRRATFPSMIFMSVKNVPFSNFKQRKNM